MSRAIFRKLAGTLCVAALAAVPTAAHSLVRTFEFSATVTHVSNVGTFAAVGDSFTGRFAYETDTPVFMETSSGFLSYRAFPEVLRGVDISLGPADSFRGPRLLYYSIAVTDDFLGRPRGAHAFSLSTASQPAPIGWPPRPYDGVRTGRVNFQITLKDDTGTAFSSRDLPLDLDLDDFDQKEIRVTEFRSAVSDPTLPRWRIIADITELALVLPNQPPDCSGAHAVPGALWPPNHAFREVSIGGVTDPDGDSVEVRIDSIYQDEAVDAPGSGDRCPDAAGLGTESALLRGERAGGSDGRVYHLSFRAEDDRGGTCTGTVSLCLPHDPSPSNECVDQGALHDSTGPCDATNDADEDGLLDSEEAALGSHLLNPDSDGDGFVDGVETAAGSNPDDATSTPAAEAAPVPALSTWGLAALACLLCGVALWIAAARRAGAGASRR